MKAISTNLGSKDRQLGLFVKGSIEWSGSVYRKMRGET